MSNIWDCFTMPPVQRHYVNKIDFFIFSYSLASYIVKALDQNNFSNAFVSGMQTDLQLYGQQRNLFTTLFNMGYLTGSVPNQIIINRIRPSIWIPICEIMWGILTMCIAAANSATTIYGIRFVSGFFESATFPSFSLILGSWYTPSELGKRISLFEFSSSAAGMFSGYIMAGLYATMNGTRGIPAWRWMFIIDGVITIPIGIIGFFFLPDFPTSSRAMWLKPWEREFGIRRMAAIGRKPQQKLTLRRLRRLFFGPTLWASFIPYSANWWLNYTGYFNLWLKSLTNPKFTTEQLNTIPTAGNALAVISAYVWPTISDKTHARWQFGVLSSAFGLLGSILLSIWHLPMGVLMFAQLIPNAGASGQSLLIAWMQESFQDDTELRSMITGFGNVINYAMNAWLPLVCYPTYMAPHYKAGYQTSAGLYALHIVSVFLFRYYIKWYHKRNNMVLNNFGLPEKWDQISNENSAGAVIMRDVNYSNDTEENEKNEKNVKVDVV
ncbi:hypothetical protein LIPSTDRAFT_56224 [Lipomyces starkeyi NRRL Y-11557]|uniref:Major facilitator superfamily (MFS) profile domain-containing protein n=1 Tax=Lipomyces starkeyi NRRL Y-11557 TaxID=675824 RepID=A0A1E3Q125_LIPST|nr:hypothetical protein LIPSTDRAFT_56224 [Lipomyces starkeyi NRRL Y-11557]